MRAKTVLVVAAGLAMVPGVAWANIGIPMIVVVMPVMVLSLIPIIAVEAYAHARALGLAGRRAARVAILTNLLSTFLGIPVSWALLLVMQAVLGGGSPFGLESLRGKVLSVTLQAPMLIPYDDARWLLPTAGLVLMVPFFFASWWTEYWLARRLLRDLPRPAVWTAVRNANLISYGLLTLWPLAHFAAV